MFASSKKRVPFVYELIRAYLDDARVNASISRSEVDKACGCQMSGHWFGRSQWSLPSEQHYKTMARLFQVTFKPYAELKAEYKAIRSILRPFNVTKHVPYTNVWDFDTVVWYPGKHPCEKPLALMRHIVEASSLPGDVVLDTFVGSGSTAIACRDSGRRFIGCEMGEGEFDGAVGRLGSLVT